MVQILAVVHPVMVRVAVVEIGFISVTTTPRGPGEAAVAQEPVEVVGHVLAHPLTQKVHTLAVTAARE
jgi:hypothetical protein